MQIIDADGHVNDRARMDEIVRYMPKGGNRSPRVFPELDHLHTLTLRREGAASRTGNPGPEEWVQFMDDTGIQWTVLYPTAGLAVGRIASAEWAVAACRAYNNWLYEKFLNVSPRIKGVALIPLQTVDGAVQELHRAVKELGMGGAMLPSNGEGLKSHLADEIYWPIYAEAQRLGCFLAVHGGCHHGFGMDSFNAFYPIRALGHPFTIMVQAAAMLTHGVFDRFPGLRVAFLEGGATWVPFFMDRLERNDDRTQVDLEGEPLPGPKAGETMGDYFRRHIREGRIFVGFDCDDAGLGYALQTAGREPFLFASDFPHENFSAETCRKEINHLLSREDLTQRDKEAVLGGNIQRLYRTAA